MGKFTVFIMLCITFGTFIYYNSTITTKGTDKLYEEFQESILLLLISLKLIVNNKYKGMHNSFHKVTWRELTSKICYGK